MLGHPQEHGQGGAIRTGTPEGDAALIEAAATFRREEAKLV